MQGSDFKSLGGINYNVIRSMAIFGRKYLYFLNLFSLTDLLNLFDISLFNWVIYITHFL